jgi:hypothetical protein
MELVNGRPGAARFAFAQIERWISRWRTLRRMHALPEIVVLPQLLFLQGSSPAGFGGPSPLGPAEQESQGKGHVFIPSQDAALRAPVLVPILLGIQ